MAHAIRHLIHIDAPIASIMDALMHEEHIQKWWTTECHVADGKRYIFLECPWLGCRA